MKDPSLDLIDNSEFALFENRKIDNKKAKQEPMYNILDGERKVTSVEYGEGRVFGKYLPTSTMKEDDAISIRVRNFNCVSQEIKLFYTTLKGDNGIDDYTNEQTKKECRLSTSQWGGNFLTSNGSVWANDGVTLPFAFGSVINCVFFCFPFGNISLSTQVAEPIDSFLLRLMEVCANLFPSPPQRGLSGSSPMGVNIYYSNNECFIDLIEYVPSGGGAGFIPLSWSITSILTPTNFVTTSTNIFGFLLTNKDGWLPYLEVTDLSDTNDSAAYSEFVRSLLNQDLLINKINKYSNNPSQVGQPIVFESFDLDGNNQKLPQTNLISPYQPQAVLNNFSDIVLDGQTFATINMLAGEFLELTMYYDSVGILNYEEIKELEIGQGKELTQEEDKDLKEAYSNFSGFKNNKKTEKLLLLAILGLIIFKK